MTKGERETTIRFDDDERVVHVWSSSPVVWRRMARFGIVSQREGRLGGAVAGKFYRLPVARFRWTVRPEVSSRKGGNIEALRRYRAAQTTG